METLIPLSDDWRPVETAAAPLEKSDRLVLYGLAAMVAADLTIFLYVVVAGFVPQPYSDMFDFLRAEFDWERTGDLLAYLASPHNHQHLVWVRVLTALDVQLFHGSAVVFLVAAGASVIVAAGVLAGELVRSTPVRMVGALAAVLAAPLIASTVNAMDCTQPINSVYAIAFVFAVLAIVLFEQAGQGAGRRAAIGAASALACGLAAMGGSAAGVAVFPALIFSATRNPGSRGLIAPTLVVGLAAVAVVVATLAGGAPSGPAIGGAGHLWKMADYFVVYAGMPWSAIHGLSRGRLLIGLVTIGLGAVLIWRGPRAEGGAARRLERIGLDLILFALITAVMAALGRVDENEAVIVPVRYAIFMSAFQVGVLCLLAPVVARRWASVKAYAAPAIMAASAALLVQQVAAGSSVLRTSQFIRSEIAAFTAGQRRPEMRQFIHPDFDIALAVQAERRRRGLYP
ncbi:MAG TPA: hypothetical protein VHY32_09365 [Caulobacteraceae bacterium]|jgi:hypothetical protein|nr:hypothetical protein [Caulobacteraceae bacterium]